MTRFLADAKSAITLLTLIPTRSAPPEGARPGVAAWFPAVGLVLGVIAWGSLHLARLAGWRGTASVVVGVLVVASWALVTRFLHWDGLADVADGLWGGHTPERRLEIMSDSVVGSFGAAALVLAGGLEIAAVASLAAAGNELPLLVAPALARLAATCAAWLGRPARGSGLGRSVMGAPSAVNVMTAALVVVGCVGALTFGYGVIGVGYAGVAVLLALGVPHVLSGPIRGVTGDVMGASVLLCEAVLLAVAAMAWGA